METNRQKKIAGVIQKDLVEILQAAARDGMKGIIISVTKVSVTSDLAQAKVYLSVFPSEKREGIIEGIRSNIPAIRNEVAKKTRHQLRRMPDLLFFGDDSLDYIDSLNEALQGRDENPILNPDVLPKRKKH